MKNILSDRPRYRESSSLRWTLALLVPGAIIFVVVVLAEFSRRPPGPGDRIGLAIGLAIMFALAWLFWSLRLDCTVDSAGVNVRLRPFPGRRVRFADIRSLEVRTFSPLMNYGGWGIKHNFRRRETAYIVSGNKGVSLELMNGKRLLIGSQHPDTLAAAIRDGMATGRSGL